ncbi:D-inositol 3-phosphate glycosyltransferase [invertebrate metagenome]|uniref:D-inositol 3-phosphate glycosyltransferase n=1 Tax=invertebrate metagenome TaxID=1711999 RepID=A0A2H9TCI7_9ZZZZ
MTGSPAVVQVIQHFLPGGLEKLALDLHLSSKGQKHHMVVLEGDPSDRQQWGVPMDDRYLHFLSKKPGVTPSLVKRLYALLRNLDADLLHTHHIGPLLYGGMAAKLGNYRHIHTEHDVWHLDNRHRRLLVQGCFHTFQPRVVACSEYVRKGIIRNISGIQPCVVKNGINSRVFKQGNKEAARQSINLPQHVPVIGCAARLAEGKEHDLLLQAFSQLPEHFQLALAGDGERKNSLMHLAEKLGIASRVHFLGVVRDMPLFYQSIDVFCLSSRREGLPLSVLEAQACEKIVVVTDAGGCREAVDGFSGIVVQNNQQESLVCALIRQIERSADPQYAISARKFVLRQGNIDDTVRHYQALYQQVIDSGGHHG